MRKISKQNIIDVAISVGVNLFIAIFSIFVFGVRYVTDDDYCLAYLAYGIFGEPTSRIVYSNVILGFILKTLFSVKSSINWLIALEYIGLCGAGFISLYEVLRTRKIKAILLWNLLFFSFYYSSYVGVTYTVIAAYICALGYLAFFLAQKENNKIGMILSGLVISFASLIRFESFLAISLFAGVSWAGILFSEKIKREDCWEKLKSHSIPFVILFAAIGMFYVVNVIAYKDGEWADYYKYNKLRMSVLDNYSVITLNDVDAQGKLGITQAEADSLNEWRFNDTEVYTTELFENITKETSAAKAKNGIKPLEDLLVSVKELAKTDYRFLMGVLMLLVCLLCATNKNDTAGKRKAGFFAVMLLPLFIEFFLYCYNGRYNYVWKKDLPERIVILSLMGFWVGTIILELCIDAVGRFEQEKKHKNLVCAVFAVLVLSSGVIQGYSHHEFRGFALAGEKSIAEEFSYLNDGNVYVADYSAFQTFMKKYSVWQNPPQGYLKNVLSLGGWEVNHPCLVQRQQELGIDNPYKALAYNENVYLLCRKYPETELQYLRDEYDKSLECKKVKSHGDLKIYKFHAN